MSTLGTVVGMSLVKVVRVFWCWCPLSSDSFIICLTVGHFVLSVRCLKLIAGLNIVVIE